MSRAAVIAAALAWGLCACLTMAFGLAGIWAVVTGAIGPFALLYAIPITIVGVGTFFARTPTQGKTHDR